MDSESVECRSEDACSRGRAPEEETLEVGGNVEAVAPFTNNEGQVIKTGLTGKVKEVIKKLDLTLVITVVVLLTLTVFGLAEAPLVKSKVGCLVRWSKTLGPGAALLMLGLSTLMPVVMLPVFPLMALSGPLFTEMYESWLWGGTVAFGTVFTGLWLGSVIAFSLGQTVFKGHAERVCRGSAAFRRINGLVEVKGAKIVLIARASPLLPAEVFDYACSVTTLSKLQYAIGCIGSAVPVAFWTYSSAQAAAAAKDRLAGSSSGGEMWLIAINVVALAALTALLVRMIGREEASVVAEASPAGQGLRRASSGLCLPTSPRTEGPLQQQLLQA